MSDNISEKCLVISPFLPFPTKSGGQVRLLNTVKELGKYSPLSFFGFINKNDDVSKNENWFKESGTVYEFFLTSNRNVFSFLKHGIPYWLSDFWNETLIDKCKQVVNVKIVQVETTQLLYLGKYLPRGVKKVFVAYDISTVSFWRRLLEEKNPLKFVVKYLRWWEIFLYEKDNLRYFDLIIAVSEEDKKILVEKFNVKKVEVLPNGIEKISFLPLDKNDECINLGYIGSFEHSPNKKAFEFFLNSIAPVLEKNKIAYRYYLAGENDKAEINILIQNSSIKNKTSIINMGYINDKEEFYKKIDMLICPLWSGSGTRIKILESLSFGRPVVTTKVGAEGIAITSPLLTIQNENASSEDWATAIQNQKKRMGTDMNSFEGLKNQLKKYSWVSIFEKYRGKILEVK